MSHVKPLESLLYGAIAGFAGSLVQSLFFKVTKRIAPETPKGAFTAPEAAQRHEEPTQTVGRRVVEDLLERGPLTDEAKQKFATVVHLAFGSSWGAAYGLVRESLPMGPLAATLGFGSLVWMASDNLVLPAFRLAAWPQRYPLKTHAYAWSAHLPYALTVWATYELLRSRAWSTLAGTLAAWQTVRRLPAPIRPPLGRVARGVALAKSLRRRAAAARDDLRAH